MYVVLGCMMSLPSRRILTGRCFFNKAFSCLMSSSIVSETVLASDSFLRRRPRSVSDSWAMEALRARVSGSSVES